MEATGEKGVIMKIGLRITGLVAWLHTAVIIFLGGIIPLSFGMTMGLYDIFEFLLVDLDPYMQDPTYIGGGWLLTITVITIISAGVVVMISIAAFFATWKPLFVPGTILIIANCVILFINALLQLLGTFYLSRHSDFVGLMEYSNGFFIAPIVEFVILAGMIVLAVFSIKSMKKAIAGIGLASV